MILKLDELNLREATHFLADRDAALARVVRQYGYPPLWAREPGFATLIHMILEQQVSLASANAAFNRLSQKLENRIKPDTFLVLSDEDLRNIGFSRQKTLYARHLAQKLLNGEVKLHTLEHLGDREAKSVLTSLKGIGEWTADIYLSECLMRTDILPKGDIAMQEAFKVLYGLEA